jgi:hypothetical protein
MPYYKIESDGGWQDLLDMIYILNNDTASLPQVFNIDRALWMHAFNYAIVNLDSYIAYSQNYYLYIDNYQRWNPILWDLNMSFGSFRHSDGTSLNLTITKTKQLNPLQHLTSSAYSPRPLMKNLFRNSTYRKMYLAHLRTIINENIRNGEYYARGIEWQATIDSYVLADSNKFYSYDDFHANLDTTTGSISDQYPGLKDLMEARMAYLDTFPGFSGAPELSLVNHYPEYPNSSQDLWITCKASGAEWVHLYYRFASQAPFANVLMYDDGAHHDGIAGDSIYGASFVPAGNVVQFYVFAENDSAGIFSPERAEYEFYSVYPKPGSGALVLNEYMIGSAQTPDPAGESEPWVELFNNTAEELPLGNLYLSDDPGDPLKWNFPDTLIPAHGYLTVWLDADTAQTGLHSSIESSQGSGVLYLSFIDQSLIDSLPFLMQNDLRSYGRIPNGSGAFSYIEPTYASFNIADHQGSPGFTVFPNPAYDEVYVEIQDPADALELSLYDMTGQKIYTEELEGLTATNNMVCRYVKLKTASNGVYTMELRRTGKTEFIKLAIL